jgi:hypothetical protein
MSVIILLLLTFQQTAACLRFTIAFARQLATKNEKLVLMANEIAVLREQNLTPIWFE